MDRGKELLSIDPLTDEVLITLCMLFNRPARFGGTGAIAH
jgi:hypothetical protein